MEYLQGKTDVCLSGGADGADLEWGSQASAAGHEVVHWSFAGHGSSAPEGQVVLLSDEELSAADGALGRAAEWLGKRPPSRPGVARLLRRNYYQVAWSGACYAVTAIRDDVVPGGTAWATTMFAQLHPDNPRLYVFDQDSDAWFQRNVASDAWDPIDSPPRPSGIWAGIGARELKQNGRDAIRRLMASPDAKIAD